jgi:hypothetical protein
MKWSVGQLALYPQMSAWRWHQRKWRRKPAAQLKAGVISINQRKKKKKKKHGGSIAAAHRGSSENGGVAWQSKRNETASNEETKNKMKIMKYQSKRK